VGAGSARGCAEGGGTLGGSERVANAINAGDVVVGGGNVFSDAYQHAFLTNSKGYIEDLGPRSA